MKYGSRQSVQPKIRHLALLDDCACAFEELSLRRTKNTIISDHGSFYCSCRMKLPVIKPYYMTIFLSFPKYLLELWINIKNFRPLLNIRHILSEPRHDKTCFYHMRTTNEKISLRIRAVWSASLLFTYIGTC